MEKQGRSSGSLYKIKGIASAMFQAAAEEGLIEVNPVRGIKLKRQPKKRRIAFTHDEYEKLKTEIPGHYHLLLDTITETGLRWEEAMGLKKTDVSGDVIHATSARS